MKSFSLFFLILLLPIAVYSQSPSNTRQRTEVRYVQSASIKVYKKPNKKSSVVGKLKYLQKILIVRGKNVRERKGIWIKIVSPLEGYIYQKRLIGKTESTEMSNEDDQIDVQDEDEQAAELPKDLYEPPAEENEGSLNPYWWGIGFGLYNVPEELGYSSMPGSSIDFFLDYTDNESILSKFRFGLNSTQAKSENLALSTMSLYAAYKYILENFLMSKFDVSLLGGAAYMQTSISKGVSASSSGFGLMVGAGVFYDLTDKWKFGSQYIYFTRQANFDLVKQYVGSTQIQLTVGYNF